ncbi:MAG: YicC family protein [Gammaproteobacteria bacterium]|nr:YicC family protein [Gammaproteobacteria bacterium]
MIESMTGYARGEQALGGMTLTLELRSVNHRFLDLSLRLPEALRDQEGALRNRLRERISRGKVELLVRLEGEGSGGGQLNREALQGLLTALGAVQTEVPDAPLPHALELLRWPGVWASERLPKAALQAGLETAFEPVLEAFLEERQREGAGLKATLEGQLARLEDLVNTLRAVQDGLQQQLGAKLKQRAQALGLDLTEERLAQELALLSQKADICEELDRLVTHRAAFLASLQKPGAQGKRLDFLAQELAREANTCAAKISDGAHTETVVALKVVVEQLREQVQNVA